MNPFKCLPCEVKKTRSPLGDRPTNSRAMQAQDNTTTSRVHGSGQKPAANLQDSHRMRRWISLKLVFVLWFGICGLWPATSASTDDGPGVSTMSSTLIRMMPKSRWNFKEEYGDGAEIMCKVLKGGDLLDCEDGEVVCGRRTGRATIKVIVAREDGDATTYIRQIEIVQSVGFTLTIESGLAAGPLLALYPVGILLRIRVLFHDSANRLFHAVYSNLRFQVGNESVVEASWSGETNQRSLTIRCVKAGSSLIEISDVDQPKISNVLVIRVGFAISPHAFSVHVGEAVCFRCRVPAVGQHGLWTSSAPGVLRIDEVSGVSVAVSGGGATVYYKISDSIVTHTSVTVHPLLSLTMGSYVDTEDSVSSGDKTSTVRFSVPVYFGNSKSATCDGSKLSIVSSVKRQVWDGLLWALFSCRIAWSRPHPGGTAAEDVMSVRQDVDEHGDFVCLLWLKRTSRPGEETLAGFEASLIVTVMDAAGHIISTKIPLDSRFFGMVPVSRTEPPGGTVDGWLMNFWTLFIGTLTAALCLFWVCRNKLLWAVFVGVVFVGAMFVGAVFVEVVIVGAVIVGAVIVGAVFVGAVFVGALFAAFYLCCVNWKHVLQSNVSGLTAPNDLSSRDDGSVEEDPNDVGESSAAGKPIAIPSGRAVGGKRGNTVNNLRALPEATRAGLVHAGVNSEAATSSEEDSGDLIVPVPRPVRRRGKSQADR